MKFDKHPFITIVVPAYNVEKYIVQCLDSLVNQTLIDHQIVVVNDGSTDHTGEIVNQYEVKYPELIHVITKNNQGLGAARNTGMKVVDTPYVAFLDSDDWQNPRFIERISEVLTQQEEEPDIIFTLPWIYNNVTKTVAEWYDKYLLEQIFFPNGGPENAESIVLNANSDGRIYQLEANANRRVYRMDFLRRIDFSFTEGKKWEDVAPHFRAIHHAERCIAVKDVGFFYRINTGGQITAGGGSSRLDIVPVFKEAYERAKNENWTNTEIAYIIRMLWGFSEWSIDVTNTEYIKPLLQQLHEFYSSISKEDFNSYYQICARNSKRDKMKIQIIRSPFYLFFQDYRSRQWGNHIVDKIKKLLRRG